MPFLRSSLVLCILLLGSALAYTCDSTVGRLAKFGKDDLAYFEVSVHATVGGVTSDFVAPFCGEFDDFSVFLLADAFTMLNGSYDSATLDVKLLYGATGALTLSSTPRTILDNSTFVPFRTLAVEVEDGVPTALAWDEREVCEDFCAGEACVDGFCAIDATECTAKSCEPRVYVVWSGTYGSNDKATSSARAPAAYRLFSTGKLFASLVESIEIPEELS